VFVAQVVDEVHNPTSTVTVKSQRHILLIKYSILVAPNIVVESKTTSQ